MMVADVTTAGAVRGYAQFDEAAGSAPSVARGDGAAAARCRGSWARAISRFTVDQGEHTERYQGIVELQGATLADCVHHYFRQSEQVEAGLKVAVARSAGRRGARALARGQPDDPAPAARGRGFAAGSGRGRGWRRAMILMSSSTSAELVDPDARARGAALSPVPRGRACVSIAQAPAGAPCRCSRERVETMLRMLPRRRNRRHEGRRASVRRHLPVLQRSLRFRRRGAPRAGGQR